MRENFFLTYPFHSFFRTEYTTWSTNLLFTHSFSRNIPSLINPSLSGIALLFILSTAALMDILFTSNSWKAYWMIFLQLSVMIPKPRTRTLCNRDWWNGALRWPRVENKIVVCCANLSVALWIRGHRLPLAFGRVGHKLRFAHRCWLASSYSSGVDWRYDTDKNHYTLDKRRTRYWENWTH